VIKLKDIIEMFAVGTGLSLPGGSINGAPSPKKVKKTRKKLDTDKKYHYKPVEVDEEVDEDINIPIKVGDTVLMGKYKNKKVKVKSIGKDEHGMPTINGKKAATFRIHKQVNIFNTNKNISEAPLKRRKKKRKKIKRPSQRTRLMRQQRRYYFKKEKAQKELEKSGLPGKIATTKMGKMRVYFVSYPKPKTFWGTGRVLNKEGNIKLKNLISENDLIKFKDKDNKDKQIDVKTALQYGTHPPEGYQQYQHPAYKALMKQKPDLAKDKKTDKKGIEPTDKQIKSKNDVKSQFKQQNKIAKSLSQKYGVNSKIKFSNNLDGNFADYDVDRDVIRISTEKNKDPKQFLISVLHEIDHARDAKKMGKEEYKEDYTMKGQMAVERGGDFHDDNPYEIKAENWARSEYKKIKGSIDTKALMTPQSSEEPSGEELEGPKNNVFGVDKENTKFVFDKPTSNNNPIKPDGIPTGINWDGMSKQERMNYLKSVTDKKMIDEYKQRVSEETVNLGKKLGIKRDKNGTLSFHVDNPSRGPYSESQTQDTKYFDKLYYGDHPPKPVYEDDESDKIVEWNYDKNSPLQLDESELTSVQRYQDGSHRLINLYSRGQKKVTKGTPTENEYKRANVLKENIDKVFEKLPPLPESIKVHRRAWDEGSDWIDQMNEGDVFEDNGYVSTSTDSRLPDQYGDVKFEIIVPAGQKALYMNSLKSFSNENQFDIGYQAEKEILLPRGKKFRIVKKEGKRFNYKITLEMIGDSDG
jgi:hypothetical protein